MPEKTFTEVLDDQIRFQQFWRNLTVTLYVILSIGAILCTSAASVLAALKLSIQAAVIAAIATTFVTIETTFVFKDKWKHHLGILTELQNLKLELQLKDHSEEEVIEKLMKIQRRYSAELPFQGKRT